MQATRDRADLPPVDEHETRGQAIQRRIEALGISDRAFCLQAEVSRKTLRRAMDDDDSVRPSSWTAIESALDKLEGGEVRPAVPGIEPESSGLVTFRLSGNFGVDVVVQGPVENIDELEEKVERLIARMRTQPEVGE